MSKIPEARLTNNLDHVARAVFGEPWAITQQGMEVVTTTVALYLQGERRTADEALAAISGAQYGTASGTDPATPGVRVLTLYGTVMNRASMMSTLSGGTSPQALAADLRAAADDPDVTEIVIDVDSPGGTVHGTREAYEAMLYARERKPVTAVASGNMCSAALWIASGATRIVATPTAHIGSVGVIVSWRDSSAAAASAGLQYHYYRSAPDKAPGGDGEAHNKQIDAAARGLVDRTFQVFLDDLAAARGVTPDDARDRWGSGQVWVGADAVAVGLADSLGTLQSVLNPATPPPLRRAARAAPPATGQGVAMTPEQLAALGLSADATPQQVLAAIEALTVTQAAHAALTTRLVAALGLAEGEDAPTDPLAVLAPQAEAGRAYRTQLLDQVASLTVTLAGHSDPAQSEAAEARARRVWARADLTDLQAEITRLEAQRDGLVPNGPLSRATEARPARHARQAVDPTIYGA